MINASETADQIGVLRSELRGVLKSVRWLKRGCLALGFLMFASGFGLWIAKNPHSFGF